MKTLLAELKNRYPDSELYIKKLTEKVRLIAFPQSPLVMENVQSHFKNEDMLQYLRNSLRNLVVFSEKIGENNIEFLSRVIPLGMGEIRRTIMNSPEYILTGNQVRLAYKVPLLNQRKKGKGYNAKKEYESKIKYRYICDYRFDNIRKWFITEVEEDGATIQGHPEFVEKDFSEEYSLKILCGIINTDFGTRIETVQELNEFLVQDVSKEKIIEKLKSIKAVGLEKLLEKTKESDNAKFKRLMRQSLEKIYSEKCPPMYAKFKNIMSVDEWKRGTHHLRGMNAAVFDDVPAGEIYYEDIFQPYYIVIEKNDGTYLILISEEGDYREFKLGHFDEAFPAADRKKYLIRELYGDFCSQSELYNIEEAAHLEKKENNYVLSMEGDYEGLLLPYRASNKNRQIILKSTDSESWFFNNPEFFAPSYGHINIESPGSKEIMKILSLRG